MQLIKYITIILFASLLLSTGATWLTNRGLRHSGVDFYGKINAAGEVDNPTNVLLVGSSRVLKQLDPKIIDSVTGYNSFNYGLNSGTIKTWYNIINYSLHFNKNVKLVILNVDYYMFDISDDPYKDAYYYPFEKEAPGVILNGTGAVNKVHQLKIFDIALYDDYAKYAAIDGWLRPNRISGGVYKGYYPNRQLNNFETIADFRASNKQITVTPSGLKLLDSCASLCKKNNVKLVLVMAPYFKQYSPEKYFTNFNEVVDSVKAVANKNGIPFLDYTTMSIANDQQYFYNVNHLNSKGAAVYTQAVADTVKKYFSGL
ncbi:hypothetical protein [Ferruginibacter sp. SUN106]|uniref:hypothetical protein n=1 Tax=Ferruginibacter sp. SUN106 TaxID=2978348 RepID=UPI003D368E00